MSESRKIRRAAEHAARKAARKAGFPVVTAAPQLHIDIPEPGAPFPPLASISPARLAANRANAQLSTGPVSQSGVAISSQNRVVHGLARHNGVFKLLNTEDPNSFEALKRNLAEEHQPSTETESILVNAMAESHWLSQRAQHLQSACLDPDSGQITDRPLFTLYLRYQTTHTRAFHKSLNDLLKLRAEARKTELGFEAQRIKTQRHEMKRGHHYWDVLLKDSKACAQIGHNSREYLKGMREEPGFKAQYEADLAQHGLKYGGSSVAVIETAA